MLITEKSWKRTYKSYVRDALIFTRRFIIVQLLQIFKFLHHDVDKRTLHDDSIELKEKRSSTTNLKNLSLNRRNQAHHDEDNIILESSSFSLLIIYKRNLYARSRWYKHQIHVIELTHRRSSINERRYSKRREQREYWIEIIQRIYRKWKSIEFWVVEEKLSLRISRLLFM
jgi:hypothetical protein